MSKVEKLNLIEVGKRVREVRKEKGLSGEALGEAIHRSQNTISKIEMGKSGATIENLRAIAKECGVLEDYLLLRTDYKTKAEFLKDTINKLQETDLMWRAFLNHIAIVSGYEYTELPHQNGVSLDEPYILYSKGKESYSLSMKEINAYMKDIEWYASLRLQKMIDEEGQ